MPLQDDIDVLLKAATAQVVPVGSGADPIGTAFRVAPGFAVTAAHVTPEPGVRFELRFGRDVTGFARVIAASEPLQAGGPWGWADHALLRIEDPAGLAAPCVLMAESPVAYPEKLVVCALNRGFPFRVLENFRDYTVRDTFPPDFFTIDGGHALTQGMSGGPVWSALHGGVVGLVKFSENYTVPQGGAMVYLLHGLRHLLRDDRLLYDELITDHDRYHFDENPWAARIPDPDGPMRRWLIEVHGLLASLPSASSRAMVRGLVERLLGDLVVIRSGRLVNLRDLAEYVGTESGSAQRDLARFCLLVPEFVTDCDKETRERLRRIARQILPVSRWLQLEAEFPENSTAGAAIEVLFGVINRNIVPARGLEYRYELHRTFDRRTITEVERAAGWTDYEQARTDLKAALDRRLRTLSGDPAAELVIVLPDDKVAAERLCDWRRMDLRPFDSYAMRLRFLSTWEKDPERLDQLKRRHDRLKSSSSGQMPWLHCEDPRAQSVEAMQDMLAGGTPTLAIQEPPTWQVLRAVADNAVPVVFWRNESCPEHDAGFIECAGTVFKSALLGLMHRYRLRHWQQRIWAEQRHVDSVGGDAAEAARALTRDLFWRKITVVLDVPGESKSLPTPMAGPEPIPM